ncbi:MAG: DUF362 domain-containing protein [Chloroflexi bacterium]|nr:DUF362 domain-containing protein [Chloroflexota bacterium]
MANIVEEKITVARVSAKPRKQNRWRKEGKSLVSQVSTKGELKEDIAHCLQLLGGLDRLVKPGDEVMIKPNLNSDDPPPAATDPLFLKVALELVKEAGAKKIMVGDCSGIPWLPTRQVAEKSGVAQVVAEMGAQLVCFDEAEWVEVAVNGRYLHTVTMPKVAYEANKLIYLPSMKVHRLARFTLSFKLAFGFIHPSERRPAHQENLEEKIAEVSLAWQPDLIIMDGRKSFITGGPAQGDVVEPGLIMASADPIALDVEALRVLKGYKAENLLNLELWDFPLIKMATFHNLGARNEGEYSVVKE